MEKGTVRLTPSGQLEVFSKSPFSPLVDCSICNKEFELQEGAELKLYHHGNGICSVFCSEDCEKKSKVKH